MSDVSPRAGHVPTPESSATAPAKRSCVLCDRPDPLDLTVCLSCASRTGDGLVFVRQSIRTAERARVVDDLHRILPHGVEWESFRLAAKGFLPLASVPLRATQRVVENLAKGGVPAQVTPKRWGVAPIPPSLGLLLLSVMMVGAFVGLLSGQMLFFLSPLYAGLLWILAQLHLRRPAACGIKGRPWLPGEVEARLVTALMSLPPGTPRTLLSDAVRLGHLLWERAEATGDVDIVENTSELLALAADAATDLARVEEAGRVMASRRTEGAGLAEKDTGPVEAVETSRQKLHDLLLAAVRAMGGANQRLPEAGGQGPELAQLADAIETSRLARAGADAEVERLLA